uniref:Uncharacterized protein n=1 Tax=Arundo donax TaxID=35708 RepID=A0A0A9BKX9_ARUDO
MPNMVPSTHVCTLGAKFCGRFVSLQH